MLNPTCSYRNMQRTKSFNDRNLRKPSYKFWVDHTKNQMNLVSKISSPDFHVSYINKIGFTEVGTKKLLVCQITYP